jgi:hypothetical protein
MGMPTEPLLDIMRSSMANLSFVESRASPTGPYEVTQLINTFLGAFAHPFEAMRTDLIALPLADAAEQEWPTIVRERTDDTEPSSLRDLIRFMRNGLAHGNIEFLSDGKRQIRAIRSLNSQPHSRRRIWGAVATVADVRWFLGAFVALVEQRHHEVGWYDRGAA